MTAARSARRSDPTRIGQVRPSHLVTTSGVGAVVDLPAMSVVVRGLDSWSAERQDVILEPRLLEEVRRVVGDSVRTLRSAPWDPQATDDPWTRVGVPVTPFPGWVRCPRCFRLGPLHGSQQFTLVHRYGRRPDLAKIVHAQCQHQTQTRDANKRRCVPARFLVACEAGHLDDFPYVQFVHSTSTTPCGGPRLTMQDSASTLGPRVTINCAECGASRNVQTASGRDGSANLPRCRGRHPHLQTFEQCGRPLRLIVLGASNLWFGVTASALHLPQGSGLDDLVREHWQVLSAQPNPDVLGAIIVGMDALRALRDVPVEDVWKQVEKVRAQDGPEAVEHGDLLDAEWQLLSRPTTEKQDDDFRAVANADVPEGYQHLLDQVVRVSRLREVQALVGFTRLGAPERRDLQPANLVRLRRGLTDWVPAVEKRGEGVFFELRESAVAAWEAQVDDHPRIAALRGAYSRWRQAVEQPADPAFPVARTLLLHTLSHLVIRQVSLECGYSSASIRERLYLGNPGARTAGLLLSTAASDSEGTLGGLVALGETKHLTRLLDDAMRDAQRCSSDPLCAEHVPLTDSRTLHAAACHACLFVSETSCENNNRWLDRAVLVDVAGNELAFPL